MPRALGAKLFFPPVHYSTEDGLLAVGGDLSLERLILAYSKGIFPWYSEHTPILWWTPPERCVLPISPNALCISSRLARKYRQSTYRHTFNTAFEDVIKKCATITRKGQAGTWLLPEMQEAYIKLHKAGLAYSAECWHDEQLVGGIYGVALSRAFFGESMFHILSDASKMALITLVKHLELRKFLLFDCQQATEHMLRLGAKVISRTEFEFLLKKAL